VHAEVPDLQPAIRAVDRLAESRNVVLPSEGKETLGETRRRLERLSTDAQRLIEINNALDDAEGITVQFDPDSDTVVYRVGDAEMKLKLRRADPSVPIGMGHVTSGAAYDATQEGTPPLPNAELRRELETGLEAFYYSAHRILDLLATIPGLKKIDCREIRIVRNKLVEHASPGTLYSFGFGSTGPRVKPMHRGVAEWNDDGLVPNVQSFVRTIDTAIAVLLSSAT